jgi:phosphohistidine phosphatase
VASDPPRRLILLRHAKSDWPDVPDQERPLAKRGRRDAPVVGRWLRRHGYRPDTVICSIARRTQQTWELVAPELGGSPSVTFEPRAYAASAQTLLYLVRELPGTSRTALLIGHNPAIEELATHLAEAPGAQGPPRSPGLRFPTAAVAVFEFTGDWPDLAPGQAHLLAYATPATMPHSLLCAITSLMGAVIAHDNSKPGFVPLGGVPGWQLAAERRG